MEALVFYARNLVIRRGLRQRGSIAKIEWLKDVCVSDRACDKGAVKKR